MERRRRSPDGFIIALRVIGALILTTLEPWRVKEIIAETIGIGKADIKEIRTTRKRVTARIVITNANARRLKRIEKEDITFNWRNEDIKRTEATMIRPDFETRRKENTWTPPPPPSTNAWERKMSDPARPAGGHSDVGARGRETAPCPGGCPGTGAGSGAAGTQMMKKVTIEEFREAFVKLLQTEAMADKASRRLDLLEKEVEKITGKHIREDNTFQPSRQEVLNCIKHVEKPTQEYLERIIEDTRKIAEKMEKSVEKSFRIMEAIHRERTLRTMETPKQPQPNYNREEQNSDEDADSEETENNITEIRRRRTRRDDAESDAESVNSRPPTPTTTQRREREENPARQEEERFNPERPPTPTTTQRREREEKKTSHEGENENPERAIPRITRAMSAQTQ